MLKILFYGELYPNVVHGVSIANRINLDILDSENGAEVDVVEEVTSLDSIGRSNIKKFSSLFSAAFEVFIKNIKKQYDYFYIVISLSLLGLLKTVFFVFLSKLFGSKKVVLHLHRGDFSKFYNSSILKKVLIKICFSMANRLIVLSENQKLYMSKFFSRDSIFVVENTVLEENYAKSFPSKRSVGSENFIYISNYFVEKGILDLITAFRCLDPLKVSCFGQAPLVNPIDFNNLPGNVAINSSVTGFNKFDYLYNADALILPSWNEGQPTVILEAMSVGTIILTTKVGLIAELLGEEYPFFFDSKCPDSLIDCVKRFVSYAYKVELSIFLKSRYYQFFSNSTHSTKLLNCFSHLSK